jgi:protein-tyrosine-phosphatase
MNKILFVCSGNTCRSPIAEKLFNHKLLKSKLNKKFKGISAGLFAIQGVPASKNSIKVLKESGVKDLNHCSKTLTYDLLKNSYMIIALTQNIKNTISISYPEFNNKLYTLKYFKTKKDQDIKDPFAGNIKIYRECKKEIESCIDNLIEYLNNSNI